MINNPALKKRMNANHRREIMMAQIIIDENTLCLAGVEICEFCKKEDKLFGALIAESGT